MSAERARMSCRGGRIVFLWTFVCAMCIAAAILWYLETTERRAERGRIAVVATDHAEGLQSGIERALTASYALAALLRQGNGEIENFHEVAVEMLPFYPGVSGLALSPNGIIRQAVPLQDNPATLGFNQFEDPVQGPAARLARDSGRLTLAGPVELVQGGLGAVGRLPVFLDGPDGKPIFWGLVSVVMRFPEVLDGARLDLLPRQSLDYRLWRRDPDTLHVIAASTDAPLDAPVEQTVALPNGHWVLSVSPTHGWIRPGVLAVRIALALTFALLLAWLARLLVELRNHQRDLEVQVAARTAEIRTTRNQLEATLQAIPDLLFEVGADGVFRDCRAQRPDLLIAPPDLVIGRPIEDWLSGDVLRTARSALDEAEHQGWSIGKQYCVDLPDGPRWFELSVARKPGDMPSYIVLARDISARKAADAALRASEARYQQAQRLESVGRLAGGVAHDFNNLLTVIHGATDVAAARLAPEHPTQKELQQIRSAAERAATLTRQLLSFSRQQVLQSAPLDVNRLVSDVQDMIQRLIGTRIAIGTRLDADPAEVLGDGSQLSRVLLNLATNARDAMPDGGTLQIETRTLGAVHPDVRDSGLVPGDYLELSVSDTGTGMNADTRQRVFEPFFTTKPPGKGTGLGLATVYGIVQQSGGTVTCRSEPGQGTRFSILLPLLNATNRAPLVINESA